MIKCMGKESVNRKMAGCLLVNTKMIRKMDRGFFFGKIIELIMDYGSIVSSMVKGLLLRGIRMISPS